MGVINLFVVGFGRPDLLREQHRLFTKYLKDPFEICVIDNTREPDNEQMESACRELSVGYQRAVSDNHEHHDALNQASRLATGNKAEYWMTLDHDVFPRKKTTLINKIRVAGFYGIGQFHHPTQTRYLWPGFAGFSREWLNGRIPNFNGIRGVDKRDDGDTGSMLGPLFTYEDWERMHRTEHGYKVIRPEDEFGLQSYGIEFFDSFIHLTNASHWMNIPDPAGRDRVLAEMITAL